MTRSRDSAHAGNRSLGCVRGPSRIAFSDHAAERARRYRIPVRDVADAILERHEQRRRNAGSGDWVIRGSGLVVVYNWPDDSDATTARVITVWREE